ncbi:MAG: hypothetical protein Q9227_002895 [Pyrenula ochraceoflavens]
MLSKLERLFPAGALGASDPDQRALERLLDKWTTDGGIFTRAAQLIPPESPMLQDGKFAKDREDLTGRSWNPADIARNRPEAVAHIRDGFRLLETTLLADGRDWILKTPQPTLADIEAIWPFDWLNGMKGGLPRDLISSAQYPKVFAWMERFREALKKAKASSPQPASLKGEDAGQRILSLPYTESEAQVDPQDPLRLQKGDQVEVWPIDSGFRHHDQGRLVGLNADEVVIEVQAKGGDYLRERLKSLTGYLLVMGDWPGLIGTGGLESKYLIAQRHKDTSSSVQRRLQLFSQYPLKCLVECASALQECFEMGYGGSNCLNEHCLDVAYS